MHYLSIENLSKSYGIQPLFKNITLHLNEGDKVALIARNGTGKSTLLRIIAGTETADSGKVWLHKDVNAVMLLQEPIFNEKETVLENIFNHRHPMLDAIKAYEEILDEEQVLSEQIQKAESEAVTSEDQLEELRHQLEQVHSRMQMAMSKIDELEAWNYENEVHQILGKLNITQLHQTIGTLSGGQRKRVSLAKTLIDIGFDNRHTLLILDEPTNHLDFGMIEWLEHFLDKQKITLLLVTHDRFFLDNVCNKIVEMDGSNIYSYEGDYSYYLEKKSEREMAEASELEKSKNIYRRELEWIRKQPKARTVKSKSRIDAFEEVKEKATARKLETNLILQVKMTRLGGKTVEFKKVNKAYGAKTILKGFDYTFKTGERVGVVGPNGVGKSTFLNMIMGIEKADSGKINTGETVVFGYYNQTGLVFKEDMRVIEYVKSIAENFVLADGTKVSPSQFLQRFLFEPEKHFTYLSKLSGGEKRRLHLLSIIYKNPNFLILDEPTNDLDLITLQVLEEFLINYQGCVLLVSHDRYFMDKIVDHLLVFEGDGMLSDFPGTYTSYREWQKANPKKLVADKSIAVEETQAAAPQKEKTNYKEKREYDLLSHEIDKLEKEKRDLELKLSNNLTLEEVNQHSQRLGEVMTLLDSKGMRWLELSEKF